MKIKMNENGRVSIEKKEGSGVLIPQYCPHQESNVRCGDWCPQFRVEVNDYQMFLRMCDGRSYGAEFKDFQDDRPEVLK